MTGLSSVEVHLETGTDNDRSVWENVMARDGRSKVDAANGGQRKGSLALALATGG